MNEKIIRLVPIVGSSIYPLRFSIWLQESDSASGFMLLDARPGQGMYMNLNLGSFSGSLMHWGAEGVYHGLCGNDSMRKKLQCCWSSKQKFETMPCCSLLKSNHANDINGNATLIFKIPFLVLK
ncbi:hypothetical protein KFK09_010561 [Dendrobium nobile]|uniref:Uncharacterized protein n=1 Tax=Dendrobium nobile TaxID=94219 RepID=A0A8T3BD12_DENNO|nr:hypothetical protein KFK09_010561 [Dendrobium nobile]